MNTFLLTFDDTDIIGSVGTGHILQDFKDNFLGQETKSSYVSRHQLFVHKDVPFTSHNSSMCTQITTGLKLEEIVERAAEYLKNNCPQGSDPGLCVADITKIKYPHKLTEYGYLAKKQVLTKEIAYSLAKENNIHLSEHGGTGMGVIGALAAVGLRLAGNDGRIKGKKNLEGCNKSLSVEELLNITGFEQVACLGYGVLKNSDLVDIGENDKAKAVMLGWKSTILCEKTEGKYHMLSKDKLKYF